MMLSDQQWLDKLSSELKALECQKARGSSRKRLESLKTRIRRSIYEIEWKARRATLIKL